MGHVQNHVIICLPAFGRLNRCPSIFLDPEALTGTIVVCASDTVLHNSLADLVTFRLGMVLRYEPSTVAALHRRLLLVAERGQHESLWPCRTERSRTRKTDI